MVPQFEESFGSDRLGANPSIEEIGDAAPGPIEEIGSGTAFAAPLAGFVCPRVGCAAKRT
jgi:hypothetical protein